jgi:trk system potassium uptake protein TrkA
MSAAMDIVICGAGEVGSHTAEELAGAGHSIRVIDLQVERLRALEETLDIATLVGNCSDARVLMEAGAEDADLVLAATDNDEVNLICASIAKGLGARKCVARVHKHAFLMESALSYQTHFKIDLLVCPEYLTAIAIARTLRNPSAVTVENFARGRIEMQEFRASGSGSAVGKRLMDVKLPPRTRLVAIRRRDQAFVPEGKTVVVDGDSIILVGNVGPFDDARRLFHDEKQPRQSIIIMGGTDMAVWLCQAMRDRNFAIRVFEEDRRRAEELAQKLDWVTVIQADPTDRTVFAEERIGQADAFIAMLQDEEDNIIAGVLAKSRGVTEVITVLQQSKYLDVALDIGVDKAFSPRTVAVDEINQILDESAIRRLGTLAEGQVDVIRVRTGRKAKVIGRPLRDVGLSPNWVVAAIQRGKDVFVPGADDKMEADDLVLVVGRRGNDEMLHELFDAG